MNTLIHKLPVELHLPGYQYCGPGTKLKQRLVREDQAINQLDQARKQQDIFYSKYKDKNQRHTADRIFAEKAWERVKAKDSSIGERINVCYKRNES